MPAKLTRKNIDTYLRDCLGIAAGEVRLMPDYVKVDLIRDDYDLFCEFFDEEGEEDEQ